MMLRIALGVAGLLAVSATAAEVPPATSTGSEGPATVSQACKAQKFEKTVRFTVDGKRRHSRVRLCGTVGQTDAQWAATLRDAATKLQSADTMPAEAKAEAIAALNAEIARIEQGMVKVAPFQLPTRQAEAAPRPTPRASPPFEGYSALPAMPAPLPPRPPVAAGSILGPVPPRLTIQCMSPTAMGMAGSCASMEPGTRLSIRAGENLPAGLRLRFVRGGNARGDLMLAAMRQGQSVQLRPPPRLCAGIVRSDIEIQIVRAGAGLPPDGQVVQTLGPYDLRC